MVSIFTSNKAQGQIGDLLLDVTIREGHSYKNDMTNYYVEDGFDIHDHVRAVPEQLTMEGFVTNSPVSFVDINTGKFHNLIRESNTNRDILAFNQLLEYGGFAIPKQPGDRVEKISDAIKLDIVTTLKLYTDMVITSVSFPVDKTTDNTIKFVVEFKKINIVSSDITIINNSSELNGKAPFIKNQNGKKIDTGVDSTKEVKQSSVLYKIGKKFKGLLGK